MRMKANGFSLVEMIVVIAILGILGAVAIPRFSGVREMAKERVCEANRGAVERLYSAFLVENGVNHSDLIFDQFLFSHFDLICTTGGSVSRIDDEVGCSIHGGGEIPEVTTEEGTTGEVPWL